MNKRVEVDLQDLIDAHDLLWDLIENADGPQEMDNANIKQAAWKLGAIIHKTYSKEEDRAKRPR